jgi:macrophage erythroblast attacher
LEWDSTFVKNLLKETANGSLNGKTSPEDVVKNLDQMLAKMCGLKRKLTAAAEEEDRLYRQMGARVKHLRELTEMSTVDDVKYEAWSRQRLDRLLVDYMLRHGYDSAAIALADERGMRDLVDIDTFVVMSKIRKSLEVGSVQEALNWCNENKKELRKMQSNLEFMLRCQQYIEMMRTGSQDKMVEAINHAKKYIIPLSDTYPEEVGVMAGLLAYKHDTDIEPYASLYSASRWQTLAERFVDAHLKLLNMPMTPILHIALSSGLSALKTPACHSHKLGDNEIQANSVIDGVAHDEVEAEREGFALPRNPLLRHGTASLTTRVCPICSTELNALSRNVRYAHHGKSRLLEQDLVMLPNGRIYGKARLEEYARKSGLPERDVKDLVTGALFDVDEVRKVFVT